MAAVGQFNVGRDVSLTLVSASGGLLKPSLLTDFTFKQITIDLKSRPLTSAVLHKYMPDGWEGSCSYDRADSILDDYFAVVEGAFYANQGIASAFILQTVREVSGAISQYRFDQVALRLEDGGTWKADEKVNVKLGWMASTRTKVA